MAGRVASQLWEQWQSGDVKADVFNVNVPLGFKTVDGRPVEPEVLHTAVDMQSQYSSLYSEFLILHCLVHLRAVPFSAYLWRQLQQLHVGTGLEAAYVCKPDSVCYIAMINTHSSLVSPILVVLLVLEVSNVKQVSCM